MKSKTAHIASSLILVGSLLFAQVAVNFFHKNHDVHQLKSITKPLKGGAAGVQAHGEHCKVCAVDVFNNAFIGTTINFADHSPFISHNDQSPVCPNRAAVSCSQGRAPPVSLR